MPVGACPSREELSVYILGKLRSERSEEIDMHLQLCADCQASLETITSRSDTLLSGLHEHHSGGVYLDEPQCREALNRVQHIGCDPSLTTREQVAAGQRSEIPQQIGPYRLLARLGQGGMGTVYKALHTKLDRVVALKVLPEDRMRDPDAVARFEREMKAVGKLDHANIVRASDADEENGRHYLVMEYVDGIDLAELSRRAGWLRIGDACELIRQAAVGLQHAHEHGLVHRDIKPSNLMLSASASVKILDLGLALLSDTIEQGELTSTGQTMGTVDYMAPEQCGDSHGVDIRADIYSLGATLYKLLTGEPIFSGANHLKPLQKFRALATENAPPIQSRRADIPDNLAAVIAMMVAREPKDRHATPAAAAAALAPFCSGSDLASLVGSGTHQPALAGRSPDDAPTLPNLTKPEVETDRPAPAPAVVATASPRRPSRRRALLAIGGLAAALAAIVLYVQLSKGTTVRIEINDPDITARVDANGIDIKQGENQQIRVEPGPHGLRIKHGDFEFQTDTFVLSKREQVTLKIELAADKPQAFIGDKPLRLNKIPIPVSELSAGTHSPGARYTNSLGMKFAMVPRGKAWLGGGGGKPGDREVEFKEDFYLGVYEVTQEEWERVTGLKPSHYAHQGAGNDKVKELTDAELRRFPVESVSYDDMQLFLAKLNELDKHSGWIYRLPKEDEWEYACRGGPMDDRLQSAHDAYFDKPVDTLLPAHANFSYPGGLQRTCQVGQYPPNPLGLFDMIGNVWELCDDAVTTDTPPGRRLRGGFYGDKQNYCRAAGLGWAMPTHRSKDVGFRVARVRVNPAVANQFINSLGMEFVRVPKGKSWLGGGRGNPGNQEVEIEEDFYLGKYEVTQEEWQKLTGLNPSNFQSVAGVKPADQQRFPVEQVSWDEAQDFIKRVNEKAKETGWVYRLPTVAQWEYACRGGPLSDRKQSAFDYYLEQPATTLLPGQANFDFGEKALKRPCTVGSYAPNKLGLYDMHGNVVEWCQDERQVDNGAVLREIRGGCWGYDAESCRAARPNTFGPWDRNHNIGLRLARVRVTADIPSPAISPFNAPQANAHQEAWAKYLGVPLEYTNSIGMRFRLIPPGRFLMGSPESELGREDFDKGCEKQHDVELTRPFYLAVFEVTQDEYEALMDSNPSAHSPKGKNKEHVEGLDTGRFPVESVSWNDAKAFCLKLGERAAEKGLRYRLPTEAEWEYAYRAGTTTVFYVGDTLTSHQGHFAHKFPYGTEIVGPNAGYNLTVGMYPANPFGLYDMIGNVCEWCEDAYDYKSDFYSRSPQQDPWNTVGARRARRGGAASAMGVFQRAAVRYSEPPNFKMPDLGFRVVIELDGKPGTPLPIHSDADLQPRVPLTDAGFVPLFNQQDLSGWKVKRSASIEWKNENGTITGRNRASHPNSAGQLSSQKEYQDFHFRCEVLAGSGVEPVIMFRNDDSLVKGKRRGYALTDPLPGSPSIAEGWGYGSLYADDFQVPPQQSRLAPAVEKDLGIKTGDWYRLEFIARQETVEVRINGKPTATFTSDAPALNKAGTITLRCGAGANIAFRNLEIRDLSAPTPGSATITANDYDALATGQWTPVLKMAGAKTSLRNASIQEGRIEVQDGHAYDSSISAQNLIVRAQVQKLRGQNVMLTLRDVLGVYYSAFYAFEEEEHFGFGMRGARFRYGVKQQFVASAGVAEGEFFELAFAAIGDTLTVYANGKQVGQIHDSDISRPGGVAAHTTKGRGVFKDVEVMVLDKAREPSPKE